MDYLEKRRHSLDKDKVKQAFATLVEFYTLEWLESDKGHAIQTLWKRKDYMSTNELYALGISIQILSRIDINWTKSQVRLSKTTDRKNSQGALFEILCLAFMNDPLHAVKPAQLNQAGYDGTLHFPDGKEIRMSIKNYGISNPQERFEKKAKETEALILKLLQKYDYPPVTIVIDATDHYPEKEDWQALHGYLDEIFKEKRNATDPFCCIGVPLEEAQILAGEKRNPNWIIIIKPFENPNEYHQAYKSHTLIISGKHHQHEVKNLLDKIETACYNLSKHSNTENENLINGLFLHLSVQASVENCDRWLTDYFNTYPEKPISFVFLYQPSIAMDIGRNVTITHHYCKLFKRGEKLLKWNPNGMHLKFNSPIGKVFHKPTCFFLIIDHPNGNREKLTLENRYFYQHGNHYLKMKRNPDNSLSGTMNKLGSGLYTHAVWEFPEQSSSAVISGISPPFDELLIL